MGRKNHPAEADHTDEHEEKKREGGRVEDFQRSTADLADRGDRGGCKRQH